MYISVFVRFSAAAVVYTVRITYYFSVCPANASKIPVRFCVIRPLMFFMNGKSAPFSKYVQHLIVPNSTTTLNVTRLLLGGDCEWLLFLDIRLKTDNVCHLCLFSSSRSRWRLKRVCVAVQLVLAVILNSLARVRKYLVELVRLLPWVLFAFIFEEAPSITDTLVCLGPLLTLVLS